MKTSEVAPETPLEKFRASLKSGADITVDQLEKLRDAMPTAEEGKQLARDIGDYLGTKATELNEGVRTKLEDLRSSLEGQIEEAKKSESPTVRSMGEAGERTLKFADDTATATATTARRADLLYNKALEWMQENKVARYTGVALLAVGAAYTANKFFNWVTGADKNPTFFRKALKWVGMIGFGWYASKVVNHYGEKEEKVVEERRKKIPDAPESALEFTDKKFHGLSVLGKPMKVSVGEQLSTVSFAKQKAGVVISVDGKSYQIWTVKGEGEQIRNTNLSELATEVTRRKNGFSVNGVVDIEDAQFRRLVGVLRSEHKRHVIEEFEYSAFGDKTMTLMFDPIETGGDS